jgi:AcrR family transcriptional regulator
MPESNQLDVTPIWARPEPAARHPRFSRDRIAAAALGIADAEGFEAVSMRRIAAVLGAGTMSLYRYIATRTDLLALIDDALLGEALVADPLPADWRRALALVARQTRAAYLRHPWAVQLLQGRSAAQVAAVGPNALRHFEQSLAALASAPLDNAARLDLLAMVDDYVIGHLVRAGEVAELARTAAGNAAAALEGFVSSGLATGEFPHIAAIASESWAQQFGDPVRATERFERGLRLLIDGVVADGDGGGS